MKKQTSQGMTRPDAPRAVEYDGAVSFPHGQEWLPPAKCVPRPESIEVDRWGPDLMIAYRGASSGGVDQAAFATIGSVFASAVFCSLLLAWQREEVALSAVVLAAITAAVGWLLAYSLLARFVNDTYLRLASGELFVGSGPLFVGGVRTLKTGAIAGFCCTRGERSALSSGEHYGLYALRNNGRLAPVLKDLATPDEARYLARILSQHLRLPEAA